MLDKQTSLLISFFQQAIQVGEVEPDPAKYLMEFRSEIETTGRFFEYLGLAKADKQSPLGWRPTSALLDLIPKSKPRRSKPTTRSAPLADSLVLDLMLDSVIGTEDRTFCCFVLIRLGLITEHDPLEMAAAPQLVRLFADAYDIRRLTRPPEPEAVYEVVHTS
jgi:hypothetical protein